MYVLHLTEDQQHTVKAMREKRKGLDEQLAAAEARVRDIQKQLGEVAEFERTTLKGMCEAEWPDAGGYEATLSEDGQHLVYQPACGAGNGLTELSDLAYQAHIRQSNALAAAAGQLGGSGSALQNALGNLYWW